MTKTANNPLRIMLALAISGLLSVTLFSQGIDHRPDEAGAGKAIHLLNPGGPPHSNAAGTSTLPQYGIYYHGGPIMQGTANVYYIWYGNWAGNSATTILTDFANSIGGSPYYNINTTYTDNTGTRVSNAVRLAGSTTDNYSQGNALSDA